MNASEAETNEAERESITVYSDYVCPFCYLGREALSRYQAERERAVRIDWQPFDLRGGQRGPDGEIDRSVDNGKNDEYYEQARANVERLKEQYNVEMNQDLVGDVDSLDAQVLSWHVKNEHAYETWLAFDEAVLDALWENGADIGDHDVLVGIADDVGIEREVVRSVLESESAREAVSEQFVEAQRAGVTGVPTFVYNGHAARGAVPPEQLRRLVEGVQ